MTLGEKIDKLFELREKRDMINTMLKDVNKELDLRKNDIIAEMEFEDCKSFKAEKAIASITLGFYPSIEDLETFAIWVVKNNKFEMMTRSCSKAAIKEMLDKTNKLPPGVVTHTEPKLNLRRIS